MPTSDLIRTGNRLLDCLPRLEYQQLLQGAARVSSRHHQELYGQNKPLSCVYFPLTAVCSVVIRMRAGEEVESAAVGNEGMLGISLYLGLNISPFHVITQIPGEMLRIGAAPFMEVVRQRGELDRLMQRYTLFRLRHSQQTVACNALHSVEERICCWLVMTCDRAGRDQFALTHEWLSDTLGVRRQTVSLLARDLQHAGLIRYRRGLMHILDRKRLASRACECYSAVKDLYQRIVLEANPNSPSPRPRLTASNIN